MKTIILYYSNHHGNTKKLVDAIQASDPENVEILDVTTAGPKDLSGYDLENLPAGKKVFIIFTSAMNRASLSSSAKKVIEEKNCQAVGQYSCPGYNTFGPFKLIGGTAKGHPTKEELDAAVEFYKGL